MRRRYDPDAPGTSNANDEVKSLKRQRTELITHNENIKDTDTVGIDDRVAEVKMLLQMEAHEEKGVAVILHGPSAMGKSALAHKVINDVKPLSAQFSVASVALDYNTQDFETQVKDLQSELISQLKGSEFKVRNILDGQQELKTHFSSHSCFIFVDNVVDSLQLYDLFPKQIPTNHMLRIVVTSIDVDVRKNIPFDINHIQLYPVDRLRDEPSLVLLKKTVDIRDEIEQFRGETQKLEQVAKLCYGIPLLLIQVGKDLKFRRQEYYYDRTLKRLEEADFSTYRSEKLDRFFVSIFRLLEKDVQTAFLDICVFFARYLEWGKVCYVVGQNAMHILAERSMIRKGDHNQVIVHDVLKAMALKFAKQQSTHFNITIDSRKIPSKSVKLSDLLEEHVDATKIEGLFVDRPISDKNPIHVQLGNLPSLRIFESFSRINVKFKEKKGQSSSFDNLCYFGIDQKTQRDVIGLLLKERKSTLPLKVLYLYFCENVEFPKKLGMLQQLRVLKLLGWNKLKRVPSDIQHLQCLEVLRLEGCSSIESLPEELGQLHALKELYLEDCLSLQGLPQTISELQSLKVLNIAKCESITCLPEDICKLGSLEELIMYGCESLTCLPEDICKLGSLKVLYIDDCESITCLPEDICKLGSLEKLDLRGCHNLQLTTSQLEWMATLKDFRR